MGKLDGRVALITGGSRGIGAATAALFAHEGARVMIAARDQAKADEGITRIRAAGGEADFVSCDVRDPAQCAAAVKATVARFGGLHVVFNNAGVVPTGAMLEVSDALWQDTFAANVHGTFYISRAALRMMIPNGGGVIVNNASDWAIVGGQNAVLYSATKGAIAQMTRSMALEFARQGVRVNAVAPGDTFVERWQQPGNDYLPPGETLDAQLAELGATFPMGRVGRAEEIARAVLFLACDDSSYMTGQLLVVDGGNTAGGASTRY